MKTPVLLIALGLLLCVVAVVPGCQEDAGDTRQGHAEPADSIAFVVVAVDSATVLDIIRREHQVDFLQTGAGAFIKAIDGISNTGEFAWLYAVNGRMGKVAADRRVCGPGDTVRWMYRRLGP